MKLNLTIVLILFLINSAFAQTDEQIANDEYPLTYEDTKIATKKKRGAYTSYTAQDGSYFKVGDKVSLGRPNENEDFDYIEEGDGLLIPFSAVSGQRSGDESEIKYILLTGGKRTGYYAIFRTKGFTGLANYTIRVEPALQSGEILGDGFTSDQALEELKRAKDKLDLEIISQKEYDSIKAVMVEFIK
jgi:hypothetical protein